eukprot:scaffold1411_cov125-Isochrysis_galbana.AAC.5
MDVWRRCLLRTCPRDAYVKLRWSPLSASHICLREHSGDATASAHLSRDSAPPPAPPPSLPHT